MSSMITTYQNSGGRRLDLSDAQVHHLEDCEVWPLDKHGYLGDVYYGRHQGEPSLTDEQVAALVGGFEVEGLVAR